jgi:serine/threonine protein kinase
LITHCILLPFYPRDDLFHSVSEGRIAEVAYSMLTVIRNFHNHGLVHIAVKTESFLVDARGRLVLADFAAVLEMDGDGMVDGDANKLGTFGYRAPEQWAGGIRRWTEAVDLWVVGCSLFLFAAREFLFQSHPQGLDDSSWETQLE